MGERARGELLGTALRRRVLAEVGAALRRRPPMEARLAGTLRVLAPLSGSLRLALAQAAAVLIRRRSFKRELFGAAMRSLAEAADRRAPALLRDALASDDAGGLAALSAAATLDDPALAAPLARAATSRHAHLAFAAEVARLLRGDSAGAHLLALAPKIKEAHRIELCVEVFVPLARLGRPLPAPLAPAVAVLRDAERHLGRWLVLGEVGMLAGDARPLTLAQAHAGEGPTSARAAWSLLAWALRPDGAPSPARPTFEVVARLSDRPSADRDTSFLFRLATARVATARPMLETLARQASHGEEVAVRAAMYLARDHGREELLVALQRGAWGGKRDELRGLCAAGLWDAGAREQAREVAATLGASRSLATQVWSALVLGASREEPGELITEPRFRRLHLGWIE